MLFVFLLPLMLVNKDYQKLSKHFLVSFVTVMCSSFTCVYCLTKAVLYCTCYLFLIC